LKAKGDKFEVYSAGSKSTFVNPRTKRVMDEIGIDISKQRNKEVTEFVGRKFDYVITLCGEDDKDFCPTFSGEVERKLHWNFKDPAEAEGEEREVFAVFKEVRDQIKDKIEDFAKAIKEEIS